MGKPVLDRRPIPILLVLVLFAFSGASALVYEVVWSRRFTFVFGAMSHAVATVLAAYMGGLALGSLLFGRRMARGGNPLRLYAALEAGIGLWALLLPFLLGFLEIVYRAAYRDLGFGPSSLIALRLALSFAVLLVPTTLMGGTLPVLSAMATPSHASRWAGLLYSLNTLGAVFGAALAGFLLLPAWGLRVTVYAAVAVNLVVAVIALRISPRLARRDGDSRVPPPGRTKDDPAGAAASPPSEHVGPRDTAGATRRRAAMIAYGLSGFAALSYEVLWTRVLAGSLGTTSYAFTTMLTTFLLGIALGSLWASRMAQTWRDPVRALGLIQVGAGLTALVTTPLLDRLPEAFLSLAGSWGMSFGSLQSVRFFLTSLTMLPTTLLLGAVFPVAVRLCGVGSDATRSPSQSIGALYSANTVGAIAGSVLTGFVIAPVLGRQGNLAAAALLNAAVGIALLFALFPDSDGTRPAAPPWRARWNRNRTLAAACVALTLAAVIPARSHWNLHAMNAGSYAYVRGMGGPEGLRQFLDESEMLFVRDDSEVTASIWRTEKKGRQILSLRINGKVDASTGGDMPTQDLLGHLPMILHPQPRSALIIGLASGITLGAVARHPLERIDCAEISPAVIEASRFFRKENRDALRAPNVHLIVTDGRNHLLVTDQVYDVIISEPSNPWIAGMTNLFTREFFGIVRGRLAPGGMLCQWINLYDLSPEDLRMVLRTFHDVFPTMSAWLLGTSDLLLLGGDPAETLDLAQIRARLAQGGIQEDLRSDGISSHWSLLSLFLTDGDGAIEAAGAGRRVTDDNLALEYSAPRSQGLWSSYSALIRFAASARRSPWPHLVGWSEMGLSEAEAKVRVERIFEARGIALELIAAGGDGEPAARIAQLQRARDLFPGDPAVNQVLSETEMQLGVAAARDGRHAEAASHYAQALAVDPENPGLHYSMGVALGRLGDTAGAIRELETAVRLRPSDFDALADLGVAYANSGRYDEAAARWREALQLKPGDPTITNHLREIRPYLKRGT